MEIPPETFFILTQAALANLEFPDGNTTAQTWRFQSMRNAGGKTDNSD
jgi:hypothetical protein